MAEIELGFPDCAMKENKSFVIIERDDEKSEF
jgi:hypothetical protein